MSQTNKSVKCPVCGLSMRSFRTHFWRDNELNFPYDIFRCQKHGIYASRQDKLELVNFHKIEHEAEKTKLPKDTNVQWFDPTIVDMKCPICGEKWTQYKEFPSESYGGIVFCPNNHAVKKEKAIINHSSN